MFEVPGEPRGKGRAKFARQGNFVKTYTPENTANYENWIKINAIQAMNELGIIASEKPIAIEIEALFEIPRSASKKRQNLMAEGVILPTKKPDLDNIQKAILDAINKVVYKDDSQVVNVYSSKRYTDKKPMVIVSVKEIQSRE